MIDREQISVTSRIIPTEKNQSCDNFICVKKGNRARGIY